MMLWLLLLSLCLLSLLFGGGAVADVLIVIVGSAVASGVGVAVAVVVIAGGDVVVGVCVGAVCVVCGVSAVGERFLGEIATQIEQWVDG